MPRRWSCSWIALGWTGGAGDELGGAGVDEALDGGGDVLGCSQGGGFDEVHVVAVSEGEGAGQRGGFQGVLAEAEVEQHPEMVVVDAAAVVVGVFSDAGDGGAPLPRGSSGSPSNHRRGGRCGGRRGPLLPPTQMGGAAWAGLGAMETSWSW